MRGDERPADTANPVTPLRNLIADPPPVPPAARESFEAFQRTLANCLGLNTAPRPKQNGRSKPGAAQTAKEPPLSSQIECIREFYEPIFRQTYDNAAVRLRDIEQLAQLAASYRSRARFVADLTLDPPNSTSDLAGPPHLDEDFLVLSTIHSAKGCEWDAVHIIHAADGMIPSDMATRDEAGVDEERRLFYVAMTRARNDLYVYYPLRYYYTKHRRGDAHGYAQLTRFMTPKVCERFERRTYDRGEHWDESDAGHAPTKATDPYKDVSRLWRAG